MSKFFSFAEGVKISDSAINLWLTNARHAVIHDNRLFWDCSSGDTNVTILVYPSMINVTVATADGYCSIKFYDKSELLAWVPNFERDLLKQRNWL